MTFTASAALAQSRRGRLAVWSLGLALAGLVLALTAAIAGAMVPPGWFIQSVGRSAATPALSVVAGSALVTSVSACLAALMTAIVTFARRQRDWRAVLALVIGLTVYPVVAAVYFVLGVFLYD